MHDRIAAERRSILWLKTEDHLLLKRPSEFCYPAKCQVGMTAKLSVYDRPMHSKALRDVALRNSGPFLHRQERSQ